MPPYLEFMLCQSSIHLSGGLRIKFLAILIEIMYYFQLKEYPMNQKKAPGFHSLNSGAAAALIFMAGKSIFSNND